MAQTDLMRTFQLRLVQYCDQLTFYWLKSFDPDFSLQFCNRLRRELEKLCFDADTYGHTSIIDIAQPLSTALAQLPEQGPDAAERQRLYGELVRLLRIIDDTQPAVDHTGETDMKLNPVSGIIYVLEDSPSHLLAVAAQIELFSYKVISFAQADAMIKAVRQLRPDLIIADVFIAEGVTPDLWFDLFAGIGIAPEDIPYTLFMSAHDVAKVRLKCARAGGYGFFTKPIHLSRMIELIDQLLREPTDQAPRVLIVDDQKSQCDFHAHILREHHIEVQTCSDAEDAIEQVDAFAPNVILMDQNMPHFSGLEIARAIRQKAEYAGIQILFLSAESRLQKQQDILTSAGDGFLAKPIDPTYLVRLVRARADYARKLEQVMARDALTGLYNHGEIKRQLLVEVQRARRERMALSVVMLDIDHFKQINDSYGHVFGDQVIKTLALLLMNSLRRSDIVGRYGGEEFLIILPGTAQEEAQSLVQKQLEKFAAISRYGDKTLTCTFSAGISELQGEMNRDTLIKIADDLLYQAKQGGRNRVCIATRDPSPLIEA